MTVDDERLARFLPSGSDCVAELYLASLAPQTGRDSQQRCLDRLVELRDAGRVEEISVGVWGDAIPTGSDMHRVGDIAALTERVGDVYALAARTELSISSFFRPKQIDSTFTQSSYTRIDLPQCCLLLYEADALVGVFPCQIDETTVTPLDALDRLSAQTETLDTVGPDSVRGT